MNDYRRSDNSKLLMHWDDRGLYEDLSGNVPFRLGSPLETWSLDDFMDDYGVLWSCMSCKL